MGFKIGAMACEWRERRGTHASVPLDGRQNEAFFPCPCRHTPTGVDDEGTHHALTHTSSSSSSSVILYVSHWDGDRESYE